MLLFLFCRLKLNILLSVAVAAPVAVDTNTRVPRCFGSASESQRESKGKIILVVGVTAKVNMKVNVVRKLTLIHDQSPSVPQNQVFQSKYYCNIIILQSPYINECRLCGHSTVLKHYLLGQNVVQRCPAMAKFLSFTTYHAHILTVVLTSLAA